MPRPPRIAIIGGGIGGLAAALALERRGAEARRAEQSGALSEIGAGLNLTPNAVKALRALGLERRGQAIAAETDFLNIRSWKSGRYISRTKPRRLPTKIRRAESFRAPRRPARRFGGGAQDHDICASAPAASASTGGAHSAAARFADGSDDRGRYRRRRRRHSFGGARKPVRRRQAAFHRLHLLARHGAGRGRAAPTSTPKNGAMWMGPHGHVVHYPVRRGELLNIVAHVDSDAWTEESLDAAMRRGRSDDDLCGVESGADKTLSVQRALVQMGAVRPRSAGAMERRPRHAARRFRARHAALSRHRRRHGDRGRLRARRHRSRGRATISALRLSHYERLRVPRTRGGRARRARPRQGKSSRLAAGRGSSAT